MSFTANMKMADLIHANCMLVTVINRFGIKLGFGDKSVAKVCREYKINVDFFLEIVNTFHDKEYFPNERLQKFSVDDIIWYLEKTHRYYTETKLPQIEAMIKEVGASEHEHKQYMEMIDNFFREYKNEVIIHTDHEDQVVFPYARAIDRSCKSSAFFQQNKGQLQDYSIHVFEREHDDIESKLLDLKNIIIKYLPEPLHNQTYNAILFELFNLENDLNDHARIEDKVLVPKIKIMEEQLKQKYAAFK